MNLEKVKTINKTKTSSIIFTWLSGCNPISNTTNLVTFKEFLEKKFDIIEQDFYSTFDSMEDAEIGFFSSAQPNIFHWEYNLKDVADLVLHPNKKVNVRKYVQPTERKTGKKIIQPEPAPLTFNLKEALNKAVDTTPNPSIAPTKAVVPESKERMTPKKLSRGRPKGAKNKPKTNGKAPVIGDKIGNPLTKEIIFFFTTRRGTKMPFRLDDVEDLVAQAKEIQSVI